MTEPTTPVETCDHCGVEVPAEVSKMTKRLLRGYSTQQLAAIKNLLGEAKFPTILCAGCFNTGLGETNKAVMAS